MGRVGPLLVEGISSMSGNGTGPSLVEGGGVEARWPFLLVGEGCSSEEEDSSNKSAISFLLFLPPADLLLAGEGLYLKGEGSGIEVESVL